ncbi:MAG: hypothetical protein U1D97_10070 [Desulfuromonadales bacterium]|nr:hypothetical protein [Desulfuromonadales bacterium]
MKKITTSKKSTLFTRLLPTLKGQSAYFSRAADAGRGWDNRHEQPVRVFIEGQP